MLFKDTNLKLVGKFWSSNAQHGQQYCSINFKVAKRLDLKCPHHKQ